MNELGLKKNWNLIETRVDDNGVEHARDKLWVEALPYDYRRNAVVKWYNGEWGYIGDKETDYYVHYSAVDVKDRKFKQLSEGEEVTFNL